MNKKTLIVLILIGFLSLFLNLYKKNQAPLCLNADEAAFSYNAYSLLKTGRDEYGNLLPLRLKSFGDYKMPLYSYLSIPFISALGLNEVSARALNSLLALLLPLIIFYLAKELFDNEKMALVASLLVAVSLALQMVGRQAHEAYLAVFLLSLATFFFIKILKKINLNDSLFFYLSLMAALFSYQSSRVLALFFFLYALFHFRLRQSSRWFISGLIVVIILFTLSDFAYKPERIKNLLFFNNPGFVMKIDELRGEGASRFVANKLTIGVKDVFFEHLKYFSPQFLVNSGDENPRFGFPEISPITAVEYLFIFVGLYYLFKNKHRWRYLILFLLLIAPLSASLSWAGLSITRSLFLFIAIALIDAYGVVSFLQNLKSQYFWLMLTLILIPFLVLLFYSWNFYLNHYTKRGLIIRAEQCGYKQLANYVKNNYNRLDHFYISKENGEPYIFLLFYLSYPPEKYQRQARLSPPDQYGFGQIEQFDKFTFDLARAANARNVALIGYPHDFNSNKQQNGQVIKKIKVGNEEIFWITEKN